MMTDGSDEVDSESESFDESNGVFIGNALLGSGSVGLSLFFGKGMQFGPFVRKLRMRVKGLSSLITTIHENLSLGLNGSLGILKELEIVALSFGEMGANHLASGFVHNHLSL